MHLVGINSTTFRRSRSPLMIGSILRWFQLKLLHSSILAVVFDPLGLAGGYLLAPAAGLEPLIGGVYGVVATSVPTSLRVLNYSTQAE